MMWIILLLAQLALVPFFLMSKDIARSRKLLGAVLILTVPLAGPVLALLACRTRGGKMLPPDPMDEGTTRERVAQLRRNGDISASLERLMSPHAEDRLAALVKISTNPDARAIAQLRWALEHGTREVVLDAALTLEELDLRREKRIKAALEALAESPSFDRAFAAAEACAHGVLNGLADDASIPQLANQARELYLQALQLDPGRATEVEEPLARLELAAARPGAALEILDRLTQRQDGGVIAQRLRQLRDQAAFAARRFDLLSFRSLPLHPRTTLY